MRAGCFLCVFACLFCSALRPSTAIGSGGQRYKVIIVGAGVAGLSAAEKLTEYGITDFIILEARNRTGGRILTTQFGDYKIDLGPQFVHGKSGNVVYNAVKHLNLLRQYGGPSGFSDIIVSPEGGHFNETLFDQISDYVTNVDPNVLSDTKSSYSHFLVPRVLTYLSEQNYSKIESQIILDAIKKIESTFRGAELEEIGLQGMADYIESDDDIEMYWKDGYETFLKVLMGDFSEGNKGKNILEKIFLNKEVNKVIWGENGVHLNCSDGSKYDGDRVLITLPLGILKNAPNNFFSPSLPLRKRLAIEYLGFGVLETINLMFPTKWWPDGIGGYDFGLSRKMKSDYTAKSHYGTWPITISGFYTVPKAPFVLQAMIYGQAAIEMRRSNDSEVIEACYHILKWLFQNETFAVPKPTGILRSDWYRDPYSKGSFSFRSVASDQKNITGSDLGKPLFNSKKEPIVFFAGEATDPNFYSSVNGALNSGRREAKRILNYMQLN